VFDASYLKEGGKGRGIAVKIEKNAFILTR
jgi:hypothetical protein